MGGGPTITITGGVVVVVAGGGGGWLSSSMKMVWMGDFEKILKFLCMCVFVYDYISILNYQHFLILFTPPPPQPPALTTHPPLEQ